MIPWQPIEAMPPELKDGRQVLLWLREPYSEPVVYRWDANYSRWVEEPIEPHEEPHGAGELVPSHYAEVQAP